MNIPQESNSKFPPSFCSFFGYEKPLVFLEEDDDDDETPEAWDKNGSKLLVLQVVGVDSHWGFDSAFEGW